jgi:TolA-binding protein
MEACRKDTNQLYHRQISNICEESNMWRGRDLVLLVGLAAAIILGNYLSVMGQVRTADGNASPEQDARAETGLISRTKSLEYELKAMKKEIANLKHETRIKTLETQLDQLKKDLQQTNTEVASLSTKTAALERYFANSSDHAFINSGLKNAGGQSYSLILTPTGELVLRHNNPADPQMRGWDKQAQIYKLK